MTTTDKVRESVFGRYAEDASAAILFFLMAAQLSDFPSHPMVTAQLALMAIVLSFQGKPIE